jgi:hypothetical protein
LTDSNQPQPWEPPVSIRHHLISFGVMGIGLRVLTGVVLAQVIVTAILIAVGDAGGPSLFVFREPVGVTVPALHYGVSLIFTSLALTLLAAGVSGLTRRAMWGLGGVVLFIYAATIFQPGLHFTFRNEALNGLFFALLWIVVVALLVSALKRQREGTLQFSRKQWMTLGAIVVPLFLLMFAAFMASPNQYAMTLAVLLLPLPILFLVAGTDWAEIGDTAIRFAGHRLGRGALLVATALFAAALAVFCVKVFPLYGLAFWNQLWPELLAALFVAFLIFAADARHEWDVDLPWAELLLAVAAIAVIVNWMVGFHFGLTTVVLTLIAAASIAFLVCARSPALATYAPPALFAVIVGLSYFSHQRFVFSASFDAAIATLLLVMFAAVKGRDTDLRPIYYLLVLNASLLFMWMLYFGYRTLLESNREDRLIVDAMFLVGSLVWDILTSGGKTTNVEGKWVPRASRLFLFYGFVVVASAIMVFYFPLRMEEGAPEDRQVFGAVQTVINPDFWVQLGLIAFGQAMVWTLFVLRMRNWLILTWRESRASPVAAADAAH